MPFFSRSALKDGVAMREVWSWAAFDFANSGYTTVVLTAVFNAYFVSVVAGDAPSATFLWTVVIAVSNAVSMLLMPVIGTVADATATKKRWLAVATFMAVGGTLGLMFAGPGTIVWASLMIIVSNVAYNVGESLNSAFLPELAREDAVGKVSGWGWSFGYCGGILTLGLCLGVVLGGEKLGYGMDQTVAGTMAVTAFVFAASALPIFLFLKERSVPRLDAADREAVRSAASESFAELRRTLGSLGDFRDFAWLSVCGFLYQCGVSVVITLSAVYAAAVMGFKTEDTLLMVFLVNITAAVGYVQDRIGHKLALAGTLCVWIAMIAVAAFSTERWQFWVAANLAGLAMGSSQSAGRAMVAVFAPSSRLAEFYSFWNMALWLRRPAFLRRHHLDHRQRPQDGHPLHGPLLRALPSGARACEHEARRRGGRKALKVGRPQQGAHSRVPSAREQDKNRAGCALHASGPSQTPNSVRVEIAPLCGKALGSFPRRPLRTTPVVLGWRRRRFAVVECIVHELRVVLNIVCGIFRGDCPWLDPDQEKEGGKQKKETSFRKPPLCERKSEPDSAADLDGLALVELEDPARVGGEVVHFKLVVGVRDDLKSVVAHGRVLEFAHDSLRVLDGRDISVSNVVVFCNSKFMLCLSQHELVHAAARFGRVAAVGEAQGELLEDVEGFLGGIGVALGKVLRGELREPAVVFIEGRKRLQVHDVVAVGVVRIGLQEAVRTLNGLGGVAVLPVRVDQLDLGLLCIGSKRIASLELGVIVFCIGPVALFKSGSGLGIQFVGRPVRRRILVEGFEPGAGGGRQRDGRHGHQPRGEALIRKLEIHDKQLRKF